jgi:hypothetical protein
VLCKAFVEAHGERIWAEHPSDGMASGLVVCVALLNGQERAR